VWFERRPPPEHIRLLDGVAVVAGPATATPEAPFAELPGAQAIVAAARLSYDGAVMDRSPALRVICRMGIGTDNIAIEEATARGIAVCNTPEAPSTSTAEHTIGLILAVAKNVPRAAAALRRGGRLDYFGEHQGLEVHGLRLGLVGLGRIAGRVATAARAVGMVVLAFDPWVTDERAAALGVERGGAPRQPLAAAP